MLGFHLYQTVHGAELHTTILSALVILSNSIKIGFEHRNWRLYNFCRSIYA